MRWPVRAAPMAPDGSIGFAATGHGLVPGHPVSVRAFGAPVVPNGRRLAMPSTSRCKQCAQPLVEIDHYGEQSDRLPNVQPLASSYRGMVPSGERTGESWC